MSNLTPVEKLESTFQMILTERMDSVPVINHSLKVQTVGFHQWGHYLLGVLVTPWFMNFILLPHKQDNYQTLKIGTVKSYTLPSGCYDFIVSFEEEIGFFLTCSLFSPMFEFENQQAAELTALESLIVLLKEEQNESESPALADEKLKKTNQLATSKTKPESPKLKSRRNFLRLNTLSQRDKK
jgi:[NiFe] hydrogenase assembly HybE family chaperone